MHFRITCSVRLNVVEAWYIVLTWYSSFYINKSCCKLSFHDILQNQLLPVKYTEPEVDQALSLKQPYYTCKVTIGTDEFPGTGPSKKLAKSMVGIQVKYFYS